MLADKLLIRAVQAPAGLRVAGEGSVRMLADRLLVRGELAAVPDARSSFAFGLPIGHAVAVRAWRGSAACPLESRLPSRPPINPPRRSFAAAALRRVGTRRRTAGKAGTVAASAAPSAAMSAAQSLQRLPTGMLRRDSAGR